MAAALGILGGREPSLHTTKDSLIRWGNRVDEWCDEEYEIVLNPAKAIKLASNKLESLYVMHEAGVEVPYASEDFYDVLNECGYPILGRKFRHSKGTDIKLILQKRDVRAGESDYFIPYIPTNREYRLHVVRDKVIRIQGKYLDFPEESVPHIRNHANGYRFRTPNLRLRPERIQATITAVSSLGLDFGAVDLIIAEDGVYKVLEVNTAPSCSKLTGKKYVEEFANLLGVDNGQIEIQELEKLSTEERDSDEEEDGDVEEN